MRALQEIVSALNGQVEIMMDGGIRSGSDVIKPICLGAHAVLIGRAYAYGLAAAGRAGVNKALAIMRAGGERTLRLLGCPSVEALCRAYADVPDSWKLRGAQ